MNIKISTCIAALVIALTSCELSSPHRSEEVFRLSSPDRLIDAIVLEGSSGATTSYTYEILVVDQGGAVSDSIPVGRVFGALRNENSWGVTVRWKSPTTLTVDYLRAEGREDVESRVFVGARAIEILWHSGRQDSAAPSGSMGSHARTPK